MKRFIALLLCLLALALCACGGQTAAVQPSPAAETEAPEASPEPTEAPEETPEPTEEPQPSEAPQSAEEPEEEEPVSEAPQRESNLPGLNLHEAEAEEPEQTASEPDEAAAERLALAMSFIDRPLEELIAEFGEPESGEYVPSCFGNGMDGELIYDGFTVYTYRSSTGETVTGVR